MIYLQKNSNEFNDPEMYFLYFTLYERQMSEIVNLSRKEYIEITYFKSRNNW